MDTTTNGVITPDTPQATTANDSKPDIGVSLNMAANPNARVDDFVRIIPEDYKERPWVKELQKNNEPTKELFKQYEEAQKLIGSRQQGIIPPPENATPEQIKSFYKALGVPDEVEKYEISPVTWDDADKAVGELVTKARNENAMKQIKIEAQRQGVTPKQLQALTHTFEKTQAQLLKEAQANQQSQMAKQDQDFVTGLKGKFGDRWEDTVKNGRKLVDAYVPAEVQKAFPSFDNGQGLALAIALHNIHSGLVKGDTFAGTGNGTGASIQPVKTKDSVRTEARQLMANPAYKDVTHIDHKTVVGKVQQLYRENADLLSKR